MLLLALIVTTYMLDLTHVSAFLGGIFFLGLVEQARLGFIEGMRDAK